MKPDLTKNLQYQPRVRCVAGARHGRTFSGWEDAMQLYRDVGELRARSVPTRAEGLDELVYNSVFNQDPAVVAGARALVAAAADAAGIWPASILPLYQARGRGEWGGATVPAINVRGLTYDLARAAFRVALRTDAAAMIFELARSEVGYTGQRPAEYATCVLAAALREGWSGPVFLQGDHYQVNAHKFADPRQRTPELQGLRELILEALPSGHFNIDIDSSTLVDLSRSTLGEQQRANYEVCAMLTRFIRREQLPNVTVSVGGEIGEVGKANSTVDELVAFMTGYHQALGGAEPGLAKLSVQTGTTHGGIPLPGGGLVEVKVDFETLRELGRVAREEYGLAGAVQHGASTLPSELFHHFPEVETAEIHLATGLQNLVFDHPAFPAELKQKMEAWCKQHLAQERKAGQSEAQFLYKTRKKTWGPFKEALWNLPDKAPFVAAVEEEIEFLWRQLNVVGTRRLVEHYVARTPLSPDLAPRTFE
jgi:fructose/tagatose bisphosphate aldolase